MLTRFPQPARLRELLEGGALVEVPSVQDAITARSAEMIGFDAVFAGGAVTAASDYAIPDIGLIQTGELLEHARRTVDAVDVPVIADLDDCGGTPFRVRRAIEAAVRIGLAGVMLEDLDSVPGKHLGPGGRPDKLVEAERAATLIRCAVEARGDSGLVLIARTDSAVTSTIEEVVERCRRYAEVGADLVVIPGLPFEHYAHVRDAIQHPMALLPLELPAEHREVYIATGLEMALYPRVAVLPSFAAAWDSLVELRETGRLTLQEQRAPYRDQYSAAVRGREWTDYTVRHD